MLLGLKQPGQAAKAFQQAISATPQMPEAHNGLGIALKAVGDLEAALISFKRAVALRRGYSDALFNVGNTCQALGRWQEAVEAFEAAAAGGVRSPDLLNNLGVSLWSLRQFDRAVACHREAVALAPKMAEAHNNLGNDLFALKKYPEAVATFQRAAELKPGYREALCNIGNVHLARNEPQQAIARYHDAGDFPEARYNIALAQLLQGDFENGWVGYEERWRLSSGVLQARAFAGRPWNGEPLAEKRLLLYAEQGLGDTLQFVRYVPLLAAQGATVILCVQASLQGLLAGISGVNTVVTAAAAPKDIDFYCSLLSLPRILKTRLTSIPNTVPYLPVPAKAAADWSARLGAPAGPKIGIVCSGNPRHRNDHNRSVPLAHFAPLAEIAGTPLLILQKELTAPDATFAKKFPQAFRDLSNQLESFADTAAIIQQTDLVISVDTSVTHLAGALGKTVWALLPFSPDWRWLLDRSDSPWYPSMRLFRQPAPGDWNSVFKCVVDALVQFREAHSP